MEDLVVKRFSDLDLSEPFFDSLKQDYPDFTEWFNKKALSGEEATVYFQDGEIKDFLYLKVEDEALSSDSGFEPSYPQKRRLKVGTFKIEARGTRRGERFIKRILDYAIDKKIEEIYVTIFPKHDSLIRLFKRYGFVEISKKHHLTGSYELVLMKSFQSDTGDVLMDYPRIHTKGVSKYLLSIYPKYHTRLFPDSILHNESRYDLISDLSPTNSIHKIYVCFMPDVTQMKKGDVVIIYRTTDIPGRAYYRSVVTSVCVVEEVLRKSDFSDSSDFVHQTNKYSIFSDTDLLLWYRKPNVFIVKLTYNVALTKRVTRECLINEIGLDPNAYWGFMKLSDGQFGSIIKAGQANEDYFID